MLAVISTNPTANDFFQMGLEAHRGGRLTEAEAFYRRALDVKPEFADALHMLGAVLFQAGRYSSALDSIRAAIAQNGQKAVYHFNLGVALQELGQLDEAAATYRHAIQVDPNLAEAHSNLGNALRGLGRLDEAVVAHSQAIRVRPDYAEAHTNLGAALRDQGKHDEATAAHRRAIQIRPDYAEAHSNLGTVLYDLGHLDEAVAAQRQAIGIKPNFAEAYTNLAAALCDQRKFGEAVAAYRQAVRIKPDLAETYSNLGNALHKLGEFDEAAAAYREAIRIKPNLAEAYSNLGVILRNQGRFDEAIAAYNQAILLKPDFAEAHNNLAMALREIGRLSEGRTVLERAIGLAPRNAKYRRYLGEMVPAVQGDRHLAALEQLARDGVARSVDDQIELHFALAGAYADLERHAEAFRQWLDGNALKRGQIEYDEAASLEILDRTRATFTSELVRAKSNANHSSSVPIFIVGMPRSGSTLVEQILASHPRVFGGDELTYFRGALSGIRRFGGPAAFPELVFDMSGKDFCELGSRYLAAIERLAPSAAHVTDKMPANFIFAGLIHLALPNAPIIHTVRDPVDTCLSCFSKLFATEQNHTYSLAELGRYYRHYQALMAHWHHALPAGRILDVRYEDVVADLEVQAKRIIAHCGLEWDRRCLDFHETQRPVRTASAVQVRQPLYGTAVGRWRAYEAFLGPLLAELAERVD
jgi:tetratricopeptide (TPR) repeat protein